MLSMDYYAPQRPKMTTIPLEAFNKDTSTESLGANRWRTAWQKSMCSRSFGHDATAKSKTLGVLITLPLAAASRSVVFFALLTCPTAIWPAAVSDVQVSWLAFQYTTQANKKGEPEKR